MQHQLHQDEWESRSASPTESKHGLGIFLVIVSIALILASFVTVQAHEAARDICRSIKSWQSEQPVEGCEGDGPGWAEPGVVVGGGGLVAGIVVLLRRK